MINIKKSNKNKLAKLSKLYKIGLSLTKKYLDKIWNLNDIKKYASSDLYKLIDSSITARFRQLCCKKAIDIKRSITEGISRRRYIITELLKDNLNNKNQKNIDKLNKIIKKLNKKPEIKHFSLDLNGNFIKIKMNEKTKYNRNWIHISSLGKKYNMDIPFLKTKPFNKYNCEKEYNLSNFISINEKNLVRLVFAKDIKYREDGKEAGCDIGLNSVVSLDNYSQISKINNINLPQLHFKLNNRKKGSKRYSQTMLERDNFICSCVKRINLQNINVLYIEDIKYLRFKRRTCKFLRCWRYALIINRLKLKCEELGIQIREVNPQNTSRRCNKCGWTSKSNRDGEKFICVKCNHNDNADVNAAKNILYIGQRNLSIKSSNKESFYFN